MPHSYRSRSGVVNNKNIIAIPMDNISGNNSYEPTSTPPAYEPACPEIPGEGRLGSTHQSAEEEVADPSNSTTFSLPNSTAPATDYTPSPINQQQPLSLLVTKLPWRLNEANRLREHFGRFGNIVRIQTHFMGQNSQALVTFASVAEAEAAYRSPDPILSNRFIRLSLWSSGPSAGIVANGRVPGFGRFRGANYNRPGDGLGFSQFGQVSLYFSTHTFKYPDFLCIYSWHGYL